MLTDNNNCNRCGHEIQGAFCSVCGKSKTVKKINGQYILAEIASVLNFDKGILFTVKEVLLRPSNSVHKFIIEDRNYLIKPIVYIIICSLTYTLTQQFFGFEDGYVNYSLDEDKASTVMFNWITQNYGYTNIVIAIFIAGWIKILFRKHNYNYFEILTLLCFIMGTSMLIFSFWGIIDSIISFTIVDKGFFMGVLYISWGIGQFFKGNRIGNSFKGFLSYMLGLMSFIIVIELMGILVDKI